MIIHHESVRPKQAGWRNMLTYSVIHNIQNDRSVS